MGLEGIVSKRLTAPYKSGPSRDWIKVKNPDSPAMIRARDTSRGWGNDRSPLPATLDRRRARRVILGAGCQRADRGVILFSE
jgi:ATP-dependent DNA ligase